MAMLNNQMVTMKNGYFTHKDMAFTAFTMQKYGISLGYDGEMVVDPMVIVAIAGKSQNQMVYSWDIELNGSKWRIFAISWALNPDMSPEPQHSPAKSQPQFGVINRSIMVQSWQLLITGDQVVVGQHPCDLCCSNFGWGPALSVTATFSIRLFEDFLTQKQRGRPSFRRNTFGRAERSAPRKTIRRMHTRRQDQHLPSGKLT